MWTLKRLLSACLRPGSDWLTRRWTLKDAHCGKKNARVKPSPVKNINRLLGRRHVDMSSTWPDWLGTLRCKSQPSLAGDAAEARRDSGFDSDAPGRHDIAAKLCAVLLVTSC